MSSDSLGKKQATILHNCLIRNGICDLIITPHRKTIGYFRSKRQTSKKTITTKQKRIIKRRFSKTRNAVSESERTTVQELQTQKIKIPR